MNTYTPRINEGGNYCGHDPAKPVFALLKPIKKGKGGLPRVLTLLMERLPGYYDNSRRVIPSLDLANGSDRQQRSERREACVRIVNALLLHTEVASLRVGIPTSSGFLNLTFDYIAKKTGMSLRRSERALHDLKDAGLITVSQPRQLKEDGTWKGLAAVKAISKGLFAQFGLTDMLAYERIKASKRLKQQHKWWAKQEEQQKARTTRTEKARFSVFMGSVASKLGKGNKKQKEDPSPRINRMSEDWQKQLSLRALEFKQENPSWNKEDCFKMAEKSLRGRLFC